MPLIIAKDNPQSQIQLKLCSRCVTRNNSTNNFRQWLNKLYKKNWNCLLTIVTLRSLRYLINFIGLEWCAIIVTKWITCEINCIHPTLLYVVFIKTEKKEHKEASHMQYWHLVLIKLKQLRSQLAIYSALTWDNLDIRWHYLIRNTLNLLTFDNIMETWQNKGLKVKYLSESNRSHSFIICYHQEGNRGIQMNTRPQGRQTPQSRPYKPYINWGRGKGYRQFPSYEWSRGG